MYKTKDDFGWFYNGCSEDGGHGFLLGALDFAVPTVTSLGARRVWRVAASSTGLGAGFGEARKTMLLVFAAAICNYFVWELGGLNLVTVGVWTRKEVRKAERLLKVNGTWASGSWSPRFGMVDAWDTILLRLWRKVASISFRGRISGYAKHAESPIKLKSPPLNFFK